MANKLYQESAIQDIAAAIRLKMDENGKTLIDYIIQYNSYNVFSAICDEKSFISLQGANSNSVKKFEVLKLIENKKR